MCKCIGDAARRWRDEVVFGPRYAEYRMLKSAGAAGTLPPDSQLPSPPSRPQFVITLLPDLVYSPKTWLPNLVKVESRPKSQRRRVPVRRKEVVTYQPGSIFYESASLTSSQDKASMSDTYYVRNIPKKKRQ